tara:strand:+ start:372 stop:719 length:348 start_codon:yes stop_codon:yes gene_type:complete
MSNRNEDRMIFENKMPQFLKKYRFKKKFIAQYATQLIRYPSEQELEAVELYTHHVWTAGDTFQKLAYEYYSDPKLWWIIATLNKTPTPFHLSPGDVLYIPLSAAVALSLVEQGDE